MAYRIVFPVVRALMGEGKCGLAVVVGARVVGWPVWRAPSSVCVPVAVLLGGRERVVRWQADWPVVTQGLVRSEMCCGVHMLVAV
jgi:hypothetical protein